VQFAFISTVLMESPHNELTSEVIAAAIEVHRALGPGLLESVYLECLRFELTHRNFRFATQVAIPVMYKGLGSVPDIESI
jgi:GxxExxY protein